jgi:hypothetical protein
MTRKGDRFTQNGSGSGKGSRLWREYEARREHEALSDAAAAVAAAIRGDVQLNEEDPVDDKVRAAEAS